MTPPPLADRAVARGMDSVLDAVGGGLAGLAAAASEGAIGSPLPGLAVGALGLLAFEGWQLHSLATRGDTVGKRQKGLRVERADGGGPPGWGRALLRTVAPWLVGAPLGRLGVTGVGLLDAGCAAARADRRSLHDLAAGTRVVRAG